MKQHALCKDFTPVAACLSMVLCPGIVQQYVLDIPEMMQSPVVVAALNAIQGRILSIHRPNLGSW